MARKTPSKSRKKAQTKAKPPKPVKELETGQDAEVSQSHALEGEFLKRRRGRRFNLKHEHGTAREHIRTYRDFTSGLISMSEAEVRSRMLRRHSEILSSITQREQLAQIQFKYDEILKLLRGGAVISRVSVPQLTAGVPA